MTDTPAAPPGANPIRVGIIDDDPIAIAGLRAYVAQASDMRVAWTHLNASHALMDMFNSRSSCGDCGVDVVLCDVLMPTMDGLSFLREMSLRCPGVQVILMSTSDQPERATHAVADGARGYLLKSTTPAVLHDAIRAALHGGLAISPSVNARIFAHYQQACPSTAAPTPSLTHAEQRVLTHVCHGLSNEEIADALGITVATVKSHLTHLMRKFNVSSRLKLAVLVLHGNTLTQLEAATAEHRSNSASLS